MSDVKWVMCGKEGCGYSPFPMERGYYERCQRTHETWICPGGHRRRFTNETEQEKAHRLEVERLQLRISNLEWHFEQERNVARTCPWPTCRDYVYSTRDSMYDHMRRVHGMPTLALVKEAS